jgi:hypothetical protein
VRGYALDRRARVEQQSRCMFVLLLARSHRDVGVNRRRDERVHEPDLRLLTQDVRAHQRFDARDASLLVDARERRDQRQSRAVAEHRHCASDGERVTAQSRRPHQHRTRYRPRADVGDHLCLLGVR